MILVFFWKIKARYIPWAILHMGLDRLYLARRGDVKFWKLLGAGKGETFTPKDADPLRWGLLVVVDKDSDIANAKIIERWARRSQSRFYAQLSPISVNGAWSKKRPFKDIPGAPANWSGKIVAITRARIKWRKNVIFWNSVPPVTASLHSCPGLISAIGIGEAPIGLQGTLSIWETAEAVKNFAYSGAAHKEAIKATHRHAWYAEEMFSRFALIESKGSL
ncbi:MAG: spheroidene monooxygenase [Actinobacteria bacterium]|nr:spheroidene monooxygenase [Actinomycetota bacterium]